MRAILRGIRAPSKWVKYWKNVRQRVTKKKRKKKDRSSKEVQEGRLNYSLSNVCDVLRSEYVRNRLQVDLLNVKIAKGNRREDFQVKRGTTIRKSEQFNKDR